MKKITLICPDDWHCHLREKPYLKRTVVDTAAQFNRAIVMPNLVPPITTVQQAKTYYNLIKTYLPKCSTFIPLMTLYLTEYTSQQDIRVGKKSGIITACKLYPAGVTTHSQNGVKNLQAIFPLLETMQSVDLPLLIHGEVIDPKVDVFDREAIFIERELIHLLQMFPKLRIVFEHISTKTAVDFVLTASPKLGATITPHHLLFNRNDLLSQGIRPHYYCLPILKTRKDQIALTQAAISENPKFFLGTDSAPHSKTKKQSECGPAGIYNAPAAIEIYAEIFMRQHALDKLEGFSSYFGAQFYGLPLNSRKITLVNQPWQVTESLPFSNRSSVVPLLAGKTLQWKIQSNEYKS